MKYKNEWKERKFRRQKKSKQVTFTKTRQTTLILIKH